MAGLRHRTQESGEQTVSQSELTGLIMSSALNLILLKNLTDQPLQGSSPLVCLPPISGTADLFFRQCMALSVRGYRVISVQWPPYWTHHHWCLGFTHLLDQLGLERVHIFGAALGGFLGQKYAESTRDCPRVASLILCNSFTDTAIFRYTDEATAMWLLPTIALKRMVVSGLQVGSLDGKIAEATEFILERLETFGHSGEDRTNSSKMTEKYYQTLHRG